MKGSVNGIFIADGGGGGGPVGAGVGAVEGSVEDGEDDGYCMKDACPGCACCPEGEACEKISANMFVSNPWMLLPFVSLNVGGVIGLLWPNDKG